MAHTIPTDSMVCPVMASQVNIISNPYQESIYAQPGESGSTDGKAIASLVLGIFSMVTCCCYGVPALIFGVIAIVLAVLSKKDNMGQMPGMAVAGMIMGIIGIVSGLGYVALLFLGILTA